MGPIITVEGPGRTLSQGPVAGEVNPHSGVPKVDMHGLLAVDLGDRIAVGKPIWKRSRWRK